MKIKLNWLNELVDLSGISLKELVEHASLYSAEIEGVSHLASASDAVVARVESCVPHPSSDHLHACTVSDGEKTYPVVCGAPNVASGEKVILAHVGCVLPGGTISPAKIRGVESLGMLCSLEELGLERKFIPEAMRNGIYVFPEDDTTPLGTPALSALGIDDVILEMAVTPNRGDLLSMIGVALEFSASFHRPLKGLAREAFASSPASFTGERPSHLKVTVTTDECPLYCALSVSDVTIHESPLWLKNDLMAAGIRPISNVVDITNYIMTLFGQPLHAFDADRLGDEIVVRKAGADEVITTLDGIARTLDEGDIVITNGVKPVALAGVMGGSETEITSTTKNVVIEAAVFAPLSIRRTATRLSLRSEAEGRYEHGVDQSRTALALASTARLLSELCGARVTERPAVVGELHLPDTVVRITPEEVEKCLGIAVSREEMDTIFTSLGFRVQGQDVFVPSRRPDIRIPEDLIEEVSRLHGYDKIPAAIPAARGLGALTPVQKRRRRVEDVLNDLGLDQVITYSLVSAEKAVQYQPEGFTRKPVKVLMPLTKDHEVLRMSLIPSLVDNAVYLENHKMDSIQVFEHGAVYWQDEDGEHEEEHLALLLTGPFGGTSWKGLRPGADFYTLKGILEALSRVLDAGFVFVPATDEVREMHPKRTATILYHNKPIGFVGEMHPREAKAHELERVVVAELSLAPILAQKERVAVYKPVANVPTVTYDIAVIVKKDVLASEIVKTISRADRTLLSGITIFDVYSGLPLPADVKSIALSLSFQAKETLTDEVVSAHVDQIVAALKEKYGAVLRQ